MIGGFPLDQIVTAAFLAFCRIGTCFMVMPGLSSIRVAPQVRLFVAFAVTAALLANQWDALLPFSDRRTPDFVPIVISEVAIGGLIGLLARVYLMALQFIVSGIAMSIGFTAMGGPALEEPEPQAAIAALISFAALLLLFVLDFHHEMLKALVLSYATIPPGTLFNPQSALNDMTDTLADSFFVALRLGSPFLAYAIVVNLAAGFVNKLTPQIPVYFIFQPFLIAGGLLLLYFGSSLFLRLYADGFVQSTIAR